MATKSEKSLMNSNEFVSLMITAKLCTPVVSDEWLPLDAILDYQVKRKRFGPQVITLPGGGMKRNRPDPDVPLRAIYPDTDNWYYACSWAQPQPWWTQEGQDYWNKRFDSSFADLVNFNKRRGKVAIAQGPYKAYHMPIFYRVAEKIIWYCIGDRERITELLLTVTHIGKKRSQGWGRVMQWDIIEITDNWSTHKDGHLTRGIPVFDASQPCDLMYYGLRPPYYSKWNQLPIARPN
jgi:CRISPR type IV-associated protein Csf3